MGGSPTPHRPLRVGLTGGIGSGKSVVLRSWMARGAAGIDTDAIAHQLTGPQGAAMPAIAEAFRQAHGLDVQRADGALDRDAMRQLVFNRPAARRLLESLLHPRIGDEAARQAEAAAAQGVPVIVFDVPLLAESGDRWRARCDRILVVDCPVETQIDRVMARSGWSREQVRKVVDQQASRETRRAIADAVILNDADTTLQQLDDAVGRLWRQWVDAPAAHGPADGPVKQS